MALSPEAIQRFLDKPVPISPDVKGADPQSLLRSIYRVTGCKFVPKTEPRPEQLEGVAFALWCQRSLLFYDMRLGKSKIGLDWAEHLRRAGLWRGKGLVLTHSPMGNTVWLGQARQHSDLRMRAVRVDRDELLDALDDDRCDLIAIPPTGLMYIFSQKMHNDKRKRNQYIADEKLLAIASEAFTLCIVDEIHNFGGHNSLWFDMAKVLVSGCDYRLGLTGTPFGRNLFRIWPQAYLIDHGVRFGTSYYFFEQAFGKSKYNHFRRSKKEFVFDTTKRPILDRKLASFSLSYRRAEVQAETVRAGQVRLLMYGDQLQAYDEALDQIVRVAKGEEVEINNYFVRARQISSGYLPFSTDEDEKKIVKFRQNIKMEWFEDFLSELGDDDAVLVFHEFTQTGRMLTEACVKHKVSHNWLYGGTPQKSRADMIDAFQHRKKRVLICNTATGGMSIELSEADHMIFYESPVDPIVRQQAEARPMSAARKGRVLTLDDVICSPVEQKVLGFVQEGKDLLRAIIHSRDRKKALLASLRV